jgi:hypothetical protein
VALALGSSVLKLLAMSKQVVAPSSRSGPGYAPRLTLAMPPTRPAHVNHDRRLMGSLRSTGSRDGNLCA